MDYFPNNYYIYQTDDPDLSDHDLLELVNMSVLTYRAGGSLYFGSENAVSGTGFQLFREPQSE
jgi:hypothetical protein